MGRIGSVEYSVYGGSGLADTIRRALDEGRTMEKRTKKGVREVALEEALSWLRQDGEVLYLGLFSGTPESLRIDRLLEQLSVPGTGPITGAVKTGQYERRENNWRSLDPEP
jgi:hypothetical protein